jgi:hypothetical protein
VKVADGKRELQCLDAANGSNRWTLPLPAETPTQPAAADIDGDGRDECIFTVGPILYAVGAAPDGRSGAIEWTLPLSNYASSVAIADPTGAGTAQIVLCCQDGFIYGISNDEQ